MSPPSSKKRIASSPLVVQARVVGALVLREMLTRYGRKNIGFLWLFVEPMIFTLGVAALWTFTGMHRSSSLPIVSFAITGYSSVLLWRNMAARCMNAVEPNHSLMYHRHVKVIDIYLARILLEAAGATLSFLVLAILFTALEAMPLPEDPAQVLAGWLMLTWFGASLALFAGAASEQFPIIEKLWHPLTYVMFPLSGAAFLVESVPSAIRETILWLPMVHGSEYLREGYFGSVFHAHYDLSYMAVVCALLSLFGLAQLRIISRRVTPE